MKKVTVSISIELELPDDWEIVEHADDVTVLKIEDKFCDFTFGCMTTKSPNAGENWSGDNYIEELVYDHVTSLDVKISEQR